MWKPRFGGAFFWEGEMEKIEVTYSNAILVWWSYIWRVTFWTVLLGAALGAVGALTIGHLVGPEVGMTIVNTLIYLGSVPVSIWVLKTLILDKKFKNFSVALVKHSVSDDDDGDSPTELKTAMKILGIALLALILLFIVSTLIVAVAR